MNGEVSVEVDVRRVSHIDDAVTSAFMLVYHRFVRDVGRVPCWERTTLTVTFTHYVVSAVLTERREETDGGEKRREEARLPVRRHADEG